MQCICFFMLAFFVNNVALLRKNFILIDFMRFLRIIVTKGDGFQVE